MFKPRVLPCDICDNEGRIHRIGTSLVCDSCHDKGILTADGMAMALDLSKSKAMKAIRNKQFDIAPPPAGKRCVTTSSARRRKKDGFYWLRSDIDKIINERLTS